MGVFVPRKKAFWQRKPSSGQEVDWANPLAFGLVVYAPLELSSGSEVRNLAGDQGGGIDQDIDITPEGFIYAGGTAGNDVAYATATPPADSDSYTIIVRARTTYIPTGGDYPSLVSTRNAGNNRFNLNLDGEESDSTKATFIAQNSIGGVIKAKLPKPPVNEFVTYGIAYDDLGSRKIRLQMSSESSVAVSGALTGTLEPYNNEGIYLGNRRAGGREWSGGISDFYFFNEAKSDEEVRSLIDAPYQLLKPRRSYWHMPSGVTPPQTFKPAWAMASRRSGLIGAR